MLGAGEKYFLGRAHWYVGYAISLEYIKALNITKTEQVVLMDLGICTYSVQRFLVEENGSWNV